MGAKSHLEWCSNSYYFDAARSLIRKSVLVLTKMIQKSFDFAQRRRLTCLGKMSLSCYLTLMKVLIFWRGTSIDSACMATTRTRMHLSYYSVNCCSGPMGLSLQAVKRTAMKSCCSCCLA